MTISDWFPASGLITGALVSQKLELCLLNVSSTLSCQVHSVNIIIVHEVPRGHPGTAPLHDRHQILDISVN